MAALQNRFGETLARADEALAERTRREVEALKREDEEREAALRQKVRVRADACREVQARYSDVFRSFDTLPPAPVDGEHPEKYRVRLFNRIVRRLPEGHAWSTTRADEIPLGPAMDNIEQMVLDAALKEGLAPSFDNLPADGSLISRNRVDEETGAKTLDWFGRELFIRQMRTPGRVVQRIVNPRTGAVLHGAPFSRAEMMMGSHSTPY